MAAPRGASDPDAPSGPDGGYGRRRRAPAFPKSSEKQALLLRRSAPQSSFEWNVALAAAGFKPYMWVSGDGETAMARASANGWDVLIVDRMLPKRDGLTVIRDLRESRFAQPILILSALNALDDRVTGLNAGADDYLVKPFALVELAARVNALGRRRQSDKPETRFKLCDLEMDILSRRVTRAGREIQLQHREFELLEFLLQHMGQVVTRKMLLEHVWKYSFDPKTNVVESHISRLRAKVDRPYERELIHTIRGTGYCMRAPL